MRKLALIILTAGLMLVASGAAVQASGIGQGPCHHGNSNKTCRPDPQPSHGKDCIQHGGGGKAPLGNGGGNQDHCKGVTVTPTPTPTVTPTPTPTKGHKPPKFFGLGGGGPLAKTGPSNVPLTAGIGLTFLGTGLLIRKPKRIAA